MKPTVYAILLALPTLCFSQYTYKNVRVNFLEAPADAKNYTYANLRLYPVYAAESFKAVFKNVGKYTPLQAAVQGKKVKITEKKDGGSVNNLTVQNISTDTIIIICGDVVKGGQQDRIVQEDIVLAPKSGKKNLKVFCVESGRWSRTQPSLSVAQDAVIVKEDAAEFNTYYSKGSMGLRKVVEKEKDQTKVWEKVEEINDKNKTQTATKTYTAISSSNNFNKKLDAYLEFFNGKFADPNIIGLVVVTGNKVMGCDLFATNTLFKGQLQSLLHSYATEAILNGAPVTASSQTVKNYMDRLLKDENAQKQTLKEKGSAFVHDGKKLRVSSFD
ncbi:MAG: ARPP-1 family domain-containing protein [Flavisolibacter sp.]